MTLGPLVEKLKETFGGKVREHVPLAPMTTYRIGGPADLLFSPENETDLQMLMGMIAGRDVDLTVIGGGSNLLVGDLGIRGITIWMGRGFSHLDSTVEGGDMMVSCGASLTTDEVLDYCIEKQITGFEFAAGIPGTIGGAIRGNAGTRDGAIGDVTHTVTYVNEEGALLTLKRDQLHFRYRGLVVQGRFIVTRAVLKLRPGVGEQVRARRDKIIQWRKDRQPYDLPSAGSVFVNPEGSSAGRLIDEAGCKGLTVGGARVSEKHANFILNTGNARAADVLELIDQVRRRVFESCGVLLETEIKIVGENE